MFYPQTFELKDIGVVGFLVLLEALLSADNALILALLVKGLPKEQHRKALTYGMGGAFLFRFLAIFFASSIINLWWLKALGAAYLIFLPIKHFWPSKEEEKLDEEKLATTGNFWKVVAKIELTDLAFGIDSILAGVAMVHSHEKLWVIWLGGVVGIVVLRLFAKGLIKILERFPKLDGVAYGLVLWVGIKFAFTSWDSYHVVTKQQQAGVHTMPESLYWSGAAAILILGSLRAVLDTKKDNNLPDEVFDTPSEPSQS